MFKGIIEINGQKWRAEAKNYEAALDEIAMARCTGSVGSKSSIDDTLCGGSIRVVADVHRIDADGNDVQPS